MTTFTSRLWAIELADGWGTEPSEHCTTICHPDGVGALQISAYQKKNAEVTRNDLLQATGLDDVVKSHLGEQQWGEFHGFQLVYAQGDSFWRKWWLSEKNVMVFVSYNCDKSDEKAELPEVNQMIQSLRRA